MGQQIMVITANGGQCLFFVLWHDILLLEDVSVLLFGIQITVHY